MDENLGGRAYLVEKLGNELSLSRRRSLRVLNHMFKEIKRALARGEEVEFAGGRLVRRIKDGVHAYRGSDYPAHWDYWTVEWVPHWETLKQLVGPEAAERESDKFFFDAVFVKQWQKEYRAKRKREKAERRAGRQKSGKAARPKPSGW